VRWEGGLSDGDVAIHRRGLLAGDVGAKDVGGVVVGLLHGRQ
jgi:hypothetical protein